MRTHIKEYGLYIEYQVKPYQITILSIWKERSQQLFISKSKTLQSLKAVEGIVTGERTKYIKLQSIHIKLIQLSQKGNLNNPSN